MESAEDATIYRVFSFDKVGGDNTFKLGQISFGEQDFAWYNLDYIATINEFGGQDTYYTWNDENGGFWCVSDEACTPTDEDATDVEFPLNQALIVFSLNGVTFTFSGEVMPGDTELYTIADATTYTGNFTPANLRLGDIVVGDEDFAWWNGDCLATINEFGGQDTYYTWNDENGGFWCVSDEACTPTDESAMDVEFEPNTGLIFFSLNGATLNVPSPIPAK